MSNKVLNVELSSFDDLAARLGDEKKMAAHKVKTLKIKTEAKLSGQVKAAEVALIEAQARFEDRVLEEGADLVTLVKNIKDAKTTLDVYTEIYNSFFPNASQSSSTN